MSEENKFEMDVDPLKRYGRKMQALIKKRLKDIVNISMFDLQKEMRINKFIAYDGEKHNDLLMRRSGHLSNSLRVRPAVVTENEAIGGLEVGKVYGKMLIGKRGKTTTITGDPWLTIPLPGALDNHGVPRGRARDEAVFGKTFFAHSKAGNLLLFGVLNYVKGAKKGEAKTSIIPLFVLKHSVDVPVKIAVEDLRDFTLKKVGEGIKELKQDLNLK